VIFGRGFWQGLLLGKFCLEQTRDQIPNTLEAQGVQEEISDPVPRRGEEFQDGVHDACSFRLRIFCSIPLTEQTAEQTDDEIPNPAEAGEELQERGEGTQNGAQIHDVAPFVAYLSECVLLL